MTDYDKEFIDKHEVNAILNLVMQSRLKRQGVIDMKLIPGKNDFLTKHPEIAKEWDYEKNAPTLPSDVFSSDSEHRYWICSVCGHHWPATTSSRTKQKRGCPECSKKARGKKIRKAAILKNGTFSERYPELINEWDFEKNNPLTPDDISPGSKEPIWWKCLKDKRHPSYQAYINDRANRKNGCPYCSNRIILPGINDLATNRPDIASEWNYERNKDVFPWNVSTHSSKKVWWKCSICNNEWKVSIANRTSTNGSGCKRCSDRIKTSFPEQVFYYYLKKSHPDAVNSFTDVFSGTMELDIYLPSVFTGIEYDGIIYHKPEVAEDRERKKYEICKKHKITLIRIREYDSSPTLSDNCDIQIPIHMRPTSYELKDALLELGMYTQVTTDIDINRDTQTILKSFKSSVQSHSLAAKMPDLAAEWDYEMNGGLTPAMFSYGSSYDAYWICRKCGQRWQAKIYSRANGNGCKYCSGQLAIPGQTDLETNYPEYSKFWDYNNTEVPTNVTPGSNIKYYWICSVCGDSYLSSPHNRIGNQSTICRECSNKIRSEKVWQTRRANGTIHPTNAKKVYQYSLDNEYIACYESVNQASEKTGIKRKSISDTANGRQKTCGGYRWRFNKIL